MKFGELQKEPSPAAHVVTLPPSAFASTFAKRPTSDVAVGIRCISERDVLTAKLEATRAIVEQLGEDGRMAPAERIEIWNDSFLRILVHRATCEPNDNSLPLELFGIDDQTVRDALTPEAMKRLWDEVEAFMISGSPVWAEATDDDLDALGVTLSAGEVSKLLPDRQARVRRLAGFLMGQILPHLPDDADPTP